MKRFVCTLFVFVFFAWPTKSEAKHPDAEIPVVGLFSAIETGTVEARFIPIDSSKANLVVRNQSDQPLSIELPATFAGVPILRQFGPGLGQGQGQGNFGNQGGTQTVGGGVGNGLGQNGQGANGLPGGALFRVAPGRTSKVQLATVCLEHGKPDPNPRITYRIVPLQQFTNDTRVEAICAAVGNGTLSQRAAQAAMWHVANHLSWSELADANRRVSRYTGNAKYFSSQDIQVARIFVDYIPLAVHY